MSPLLFRILLPLVLVGPASAQSPAAPRSISSRPSPERNYRLFVGVDLKVMNKSELRNVSDFENQRIRLEGDTQIAPRDLGQVQFVHNTKLGQHPITVAEFDYLRSFTVEADDQLEAMKKQNSMQMYNQDRIQQLELSVISAAQFGPDGPIDIGGGKTIMPPDLNLAVNNFESFEQNNALTNDLEFLTRKGGKSGDDEFNTIVVRANISCPVPLVDTYAVGIARILTPDHKTKDVIFFEDVGDIGPEPRGIMIQKQGLPLGFELQDLKLHIYREGQELVSDQSEKQFALTRDEALEYIALERVSSNRRKTLPAEPAWSLVPASLLASDRPENFDFPLTVHVDARGRVTAIDESSIVPGHIGAIINELLFLPAIENGVAIPSQTQVNLRDFFR